MILCGISSIRCLSQTIKARELKFLENVSPPAFVTCHATRVMCQISCVTCHLSYVTIFFLFFLFNFFFVILFWTKWWSLSVENFFYRRGLPRLVFFYRLIHLYYLNIQLKKLLSRIMQRNLVNAPSMSFFLSFSTKPI